MYQYFHLGELFDPRVRDMAGGICAGTNWGTSFIVTLVFAPLQVSVQYKTFLALILGYMEASEHK